MSQLITSDLSSLLQTNQFIQHSAHFCGQCINRKYEVCSNIRKFFVYLMNYFFIHLYLCCSHKIISIGYYSLMSICFLVYKTFLDCILWYSKRLTLFSDFVCLNSRKMSFYRFFVCLEKRKKSRGAISGEYSGYCIITVLFLTKNC